MNLVRDCEFSSSHFGFEDAYGADKELTRIAERIIRGVKSLTQFTGAWIPRKQGDTDVVTEANIEAMHMDEEILYILPDSVTFDGYEPKYVYTDGSYNSYIGAIDKNVAILKLGNDFNKEMLVNLVNRAAEATEASNVAEARKAYQRAQVEKYIDQRRKVKALEIDRDLASKREQYKSASNQVIVLSRGIEELETLKIAYAEKDGERESIMQEMQELFDSPTLVSVDFDGDYIVFKTTDLGIYDAGRKFHPIGEFEVRVNSTSSEINIRNTNNHISPGADCGNIPHPHVSGSGEPCLGNIGSVVPELIAKFDINGLWQIVLSYLTSYNPTDSWGRRLKYWPSYDKEGGTKLGDMLNLDSTVEQEKKGKGREARAKWHCDFCNDDHYVTEEPENICPVCGTHFCYASTDKVDYAGELYCCEGCAEAMKASQGVV